MTKTETDMDRRRHARIDDIREATRAAKIEVLEAVLEDLYAIRAAWSANTPLNDTVARVQARLERLKADR